MSSRSFRSVFMVASCAGAALGCYLVSLRVASERAALEKVETEIVLAQRDIRLLQTEIGTRGRLAQLERWNVKVLALSAPSADQFLDGGFALARLVAPNDKVDLDAPVVLAAAPADGPAPQVEGRRAQPEQALEDGVPARRMLHVASLKRDIKSEARPSAGQAAEAPKPAAARSVAPKPTDKPAGTTAAAKAPTAKAATASTVKAATAKAPTTKAPTAKAPTTSARTAQAKPAAARGRAAESDPLAPLGRTQKPKTLAAREPATKDSGSKQ